MKESRFAEKLLKQMLVKRLNQQGLAQLSRVSDSEVSRILAGKSRPGLENAFKLARAVEVSLDYLADDALDEDPLQEVDPASADEREILEIVRQLGTRSALRILDAVQILGHEVAIRRLYGAEMKPVIEVGDGSRPVAPATTSSARASSA